MRSLLLDEAFEFHLHHGVQLELALQILSLQLDVAVAHIDALLHLRRRLVLVAVVLLSRGHRQLQVLVDLDVGSEHQTTFAPVYPWRLGFLLRFGHDELLED